MKVLKFAARIYENLSFPHTEKVVKESNLTEVLKSQARLGLLKLKYDIDYVNDLIELIIRITADFEPELENKESTEIDDTDDDESDDEKWQELQEIFM